MAPVGAVDLPPPGRGGGRARRREVVGQQPGEDERPAEALGLGDVAGRLDERGELPRSRRRAASIRNGASDDLAHRPLAVGREAVGVVAAHQERAAGQVDEVGGGGAAHPRQPTRATRRAGRRGTRRRRSATAPGKAASTRPTPAMQATPPETTEKRTPAERGHGRRPRRRRVAARWPRRPRTPTTCARAGGRA